MSKRNMPGTPKQYSIARPAQGQGKRAASFEHIGKHAKQKLATPKYTAAARRSGGLDGS